MKLNLWANRNSIVRVKLHGQDMMICTLKTKKKTKLGY